MSNYPTAAELMPRDVAMIAHTNEDGVVFLKFFKPEGMRALAIETSIDEYRRAAELTQGFMSRVSPILDR